MPKIRKRCSRCALRSSYALTKRRTIGAFLSQIVGKLLGDTPSIESEVDHNACISCGTMSVTEVERESTQEEKEMRR